MKKSFLFCALLSALLSNAQAGHIVISQVYGAGGNTAALYKYDFVELYNPTDQAVSLSGWSLQYAGAATSNWNSNNTALSGFIAPGKYFLIQLGNAGTEGKALPSPDLVSTAISMSATAGKVALVNNTTLLSGDCPLPNTAIIDFVGFGTANCFEGAKGQATSSAYSISRINNGCTDNNNNSTDFIQTIPSPRNSQMAGHLCNGNTITITGTAPSVFCVEANSGAKGTVNFSSSGTFTNSNFRVMLSDVNGSFGYATQVGAQTVSGTNPSGSINITIPPGQLSSAAYRLRIEANNPDLLGNISNTIEIINGVKNIEPKQFWAAPDSNFIKIKWINPASCFDEVLVVAKQGSSINGVPSGDGAAYQADLNFNGNGSAFDGGKVVYKGTTSGQIITGLVMNEMYYFKIFVRKGTVWSEGQEINSRPHRVPYKGEILINQFSPQYIAGTGYSKTEYIEIVNTTDKTFDLSDVFIDVKNSTGANVVAGGTLSGTLLPHAYWLIADLTVTNITVGNTTNLPPDVHKDLGIAATNNQIGLLRKTDSSLLDAVAYGSITNKIYVEGMPAPIPPGNPGYGGLKRKTPGMDTDNNAQDFEKVGAEFIALRNSSSRLYKEGNIIPAGNYHKIDITGNVTTSGLVALSDSLNLISGKLILNSYDVYAKYAFAKGENYWVQTNGTGALTLTSVETAAYFPVGNSTFNPVTISNGSGLSWRVHVKDAIAPLPTPFNADAAIQRTWDVTPQGTPAQGATIRFEYSDAQGGADYQKDSMVQVWNYHNDAWQTASQPQNAEPLSPGRKAATVADYSAFSPFVIANAFKEDAVFPVRFISFTAQQSAQGVMLHFVNASETEVDHYAVERADAANSVFKAIGQIKPLHNDNRQVEYSWLDESPLKGLALYRIKGVDKDGTTRYTQVLRVQANVSQKLVIYPNPISARLLNWSAALQKNVYNLRVVNSAGVTVLQKSFAHAGGIYSGSVQLPAALPSGTYIFELKSKSTRQQQAFLIQ